MQKSVSTPQVTFPLVKTQKSQKIEKIDCAHERIFVPTEPLHPKYRKTKKNNHVNLCSTRDPIHTHTVIYRFRAIASPPRGHRRQAQRSCPPRERPPEGILDIFFCALFFCFFLYFGCRGSVGTNILSWAHHIFLPKKILNPTSSNKNKRTTTNEQQQTNNNRTNKPPFCLSF